MKTELLAMSLFAALLISTVANAQDSDEVGMVIEVKPKAIAAALKIDPTIVATYLRSMTPLGKGESSPALQSVTMLMPNDPAYSRPRAVRYKTTKDHDFADIILGWTHGDDLSQLKKVQHKSEAILVDESQGEAGLAFWRPNKRTLIVDTPAEMKSRIEGRPRDVPILDSNWSKIAEKSLIAVAFSGDYVRAMGPPPPSGGPGGEYQKRIDATNKSLRENLAAGFISLDIKDDIALNLTLSCTSSENAAELAKEIAKDLKFARTAIATQKAFLKENPEVPALQKIGVTLGDALLGTLKVDASGKAIAISATAKTPGNLQEAFEPPTQ